MGVIGFSFPGPNLGCTSIVLASKNELLNSLLSFSSGKVLLCQQRHILVGLPVQSLCSKDDNVLAALQMAEENFGAGGTKLPFPCKQPAPKHTGWPKRPKGPEEPVHY